MLRAVNFFRGYVEVTIEGAFPERFINVCALNGIAFWDLRRMDETVMRAKMHLSGFKQVQPFAERAMCRVVPLRKSGVSVFLWRLRRRYALLAGCVLTIGALYVLSQFVWEFEVTGNSLVSTDAILKNLAEIGIKPGVYGPSVDIDTVKNEMILRIEELSWLTVNIKGSHATVEVRERVPKPEIVPLDTPCNVVSGQSGVITRIDTLAGSAQVQVGQTVTAGQLLVSGIVDSGEMGARFVHARANVYARVWRDLTAKIPLTATGKEYTGRVKTRRTLVIAGYRISFYFSDFKSFKECDKIDKISTLRLPFGIVLPISLVTEEYREYIPQPYTMEEKTVESLLKNALSRRLENMLGESEILKAGFAEERSGASLTVRLLAECEEQIAVQAPMEPEPAEDRQENR